MTVLQIQMILHYYAIAAPYAANEPEHASSPAVRDQRNQLQSSKMIEASADSPSGFRVTEKGRAYVDALCTMPLPIAQWIIPKDI